MYRCFVYVIRSKKDLSLYIGKTEDLERRLLEHNTKKVVSTKSRAPFDLVYYECFINKGDSWAREKYLKSGAGSLQLKKILTRTLTKVD